MYALILDRDGNELASMKARVTHPISYKNMKTLVTTFKKTASLFGRFFLWLYYPLYIVLMHVIVWIVVVFTLITLVFAISIIHLGSTLQHYDTQTIHVKGQTTMYLSYPISTYSLNILLDTSGGDVEDHTYTEILYTDHLDGALADFLVSLKGVLEQIPR